MSGAEIALPEVPGESDINHGLVAQLFERGLGGDYGGFVKLEPPRC